MRLLGYGEDALTLWALNTKLADILQGLGDPSPPVACLAFFRPSFGRKGGHKSAQFGEFDFLLLAQQCLYLGESKWDRSSEAIVYGDLTLRAEQSLRHRVFTAYVDAWMQGDYSEWIAYTAQVGRRLLEQGIQKPVAPPYSLLARNLHTILHQIKAHYRAHHVAAPTVKNALLYFYDETGPRPALITAGGDFSVVQIGYLAGFVELQERQPDQQRLPQFFRASPLSAAELGSTRTAGLPLTGVDLRRTSVPAGVDHSESPGVAGTLLDGVDFLRSLLEIPSLSGQETAASTFLTAWMAGRGMRAFVDAAGNAVGILDGGPGADGQAPQDIVLLGHIDTVGGDVPVRIDDGKLYGRGAVDAKGPLAAFAAAAAQLRPQPGWRIVVVGAVEEETATSKGARFAATQYRPALCVIGEPSGWNRLTLGYKGRLLAHVTLRQAMAHTAGPDASVCERAVDLWLRVRGRMAEINAGKARVWDQVQASLRSLHSGSDGLQDTAQMTLGFRLPLDFGPEAVRTELLALSGEGELRLEGAEPAFRSEKNNALVRAFLAAIRSQGEQPGFVLKTGTSDMNVVGPVWRCPIVAYGPGDSALDHTPEEHVRIDEWRRGVQVLVDTLQGIVGMRHMV